MLWVLVHAHLYYDMNCDMNYVNMKDIQWSNISDISANGPNNTTWQHNKEKSFLKDTDDGR